MSKEVFNWKAETNDFEEEIRFETRIVQLGDGYTQVQPKGINNRKRTWSLTVWGAKTKIDEVAAFFDRHAGVKSFIWGYNEAEVRVKKYRRRNAGGVVWRISCEFEEV